MNIGSTPRERQPLTFFLALAAAALPLVCAQDAPPASPVVSSEAIVSEREKVELVTDSNVSEAINRRPDLQFNNVTIDGEASGTALSDIPAEAADSLEVMRAITPDLDADARGGTLNVESRPTFQLEETVNKLDLSAEFDGEGPVWGSNVSLSRSASLGDFGYRLSLSRERNDGYDEESHSDWLYLESEDTFVPEFIAAEIKQSKFSDTNLNSRIDYGISESLYLFARLEYGKREYSEYKPKLAYRFDAGSYQDITDTSGSSFGARIERDLLHFDSIRTRRYWQLGAVHQSDSFKLDAKLSLEKSHYFEPNWFVIQFQNDDVDLDFSWDDARYIDIQTTEDTASEYQFQELFDERWHSNQDNLVTTVNARRDFETAKLSGFLKAGFKYRNRDKEQSSDGLLFDNFNGAFSIADIPRQIGSTRELEHSYLLGTVPDDQAARDFFRDNLDSFELNTRRTREGSDGNSYLVTENVSSAYVMLNTETGNLRSILGARFEKTDISYSANEVVIDQNGNYAATLPQAAERDYDNFFPSFHLRYFLGRRATIIGSYTQSIKRPGYGNVVPYRSVDYENRSVNEGNPELEPTLFDNIDLSIDYKLTDESLLSVELFNRDISDLVFWEITLIDSGPFAGFERGRSTNGPNATRNGANLIWNQSLADWNPKLEGWRFNIKASFIDSESEYPNRPDSSLPAVWDSQSSLQVSTTYDREKLFLQLLFKTRDNYLTSVDDLEWRDRYETGRDILDLTTSYQLKDNTRLFVEVENILATPNQHYIGSDQRPTYYGVSEREYTAGLRMQF